MAEWAATAYAMSPAAWIAGGIVFTLFAGMILGWIKAPAWTKRRRNVTGVLALAIVLLAVVPGVVSFYGAQQIADSVPVTARGDNRGSDQEPRLTGNRLSSPSVNTVTNDPVLGDMRNFLRVAAGSDPSDDAFLDYLELRSDRVLTFRFFLHNNADTASGSAVENLRARFLVPTSFSTEPSVEAKYSFSGGSGHTTYVIDSGDTPIRLIPLIGDTRYSNAKLGPGGYLVSSDIFSGGGTPIGCTKEDGIILADEECNGYIDIPVRIETRSTVAKDTSLSATSKMRAAGSGEWSDTITLKPGEDAEIYWSLQNQGSEASRDIHVQVALTNLSPGDTPPQTVSLDGLSHSDIDFSTLKEKKYVIGVLEAGNHTSLLIPVKTPLVSDTEDCAPQEAWATITASVYGQPSSIQWARLTVEPDCS